VRLTPLEIRKQTFSRRRLGGVDSDEVQDFLNLVAAEMEEIVRENSVVREKLDAANHQIAEFKSMEETLRRTLLRAEEMSSESQENARRECELILKEGRLRADRVLEDARGRLKLLTNEIEELHKKKEVYLHRFRSLVEMQMELLEHHRQDYDEISHLATEAQDSVERYSRPFDSSVEGEAGRAEPPVSEPSLESPPGEEAAEVATAHSEGGFLELSADDDT
jgi:cell division initiation protein